MERLEKIKILVVVALCAAVAGLYSFDGGYETISPSVLPNLGFEEGLAHWKYSRHAPKLIDGEPNAVAMRTPEGSPAAYLMQLIWRAERFTHFRVAADVRPLKVPEGEFWWQNAVVMMRSFRKDFHEIPYWPNRLVTTSGTGEWTSYEEVFPVHPDAEVMQFIVNLGGPEGTFLVRNIAVDAVREEIWFSAAKGILGLAWIAVGAWIAVPMVFRRGAGILPFVAGAVGLAILVAALIPQLRYSIIVGHVATSIGGWLATSEISRPRPTSNTVGGPGRHADQPNRPVVKEKGTGERQPQDRRKYGESNTSQDKIGKTTSNSGSRPRFELPLFGVHFYSHMLLAVIALYAHRNTKLIKLIIYLCVFSVISEFIQYFSVTRTTQFVDLLNNFGGIVIGVTACLVWDSLVRRVPALVPARRSPPGEAGRNLDSLPLD